MKYALIALFSILLASAVGLLSSCVRRALPTYERTYQEDLVVERKKNKYKLYLPKDSTWTVYVGPSPSEIDWETPLLQFDGKVKKFKYDEEAPRLFFGIRMPLGPPVVATERQIHLNHVPNFRDMGGIPTRDGRQVAWGKLYRSGSLHKLKPKDFDRLRALGISTVCDLRNNVETVERPDLLPEDIVYEQHAIGGKEGAAYADLKRRVKEEKYRGTQIRDLFVDIMASFTDSAALDFKPILDNMLREDQGPLVFHCAGGKDRTGFLATIILSALNVDRSVIKQDYLMSNFYRQRHNRNRGRMAKLIFYDDATIQYGLRVHEAYIDAVFRVVDEEFGGMDNYLEQKFGLDSEKRRQLVERYTVPTERFNEKLPTE